MLTATEVARLLSLHVNTDKGIINAYRIGSRGDRRYRQEDIHSFLARNSSKGRKILLRVT
jgi:hypothetical protein